MHLYVMGIIIDFLELSLFLIGLYYVAVGVFSFFKKRDIPPKDERYTSFAVIIPAHNEGEVVGQLIESINKVDYPSGLIKVFVVADNCSDNTAYVAEKCGAEVIRRTSGRSNKSAAVAAAIAIIQSGGFDAEYYTVIDADNLVRNDYFHQMNSMLACGYDAVQGNVEAKNPNKNWLTAAYSLWHYLETRFGKLGPHNLGFGCKICGTGYAVKADVFCEILNDARESSLAEDLEYTMLLAIKNIKVAFAEKAVVYDEKPSEVSASLKQRTRWAQGVVDVQGRFGFRLIKRGKFIDWLSLYGDFLGVFSYTVFGIISVFSTISVLFGYDFPLCRLWTNPICYVALNIYLGLGFMTAMIGLVVDKKFNRYIVFNIFGFILYCITWIPSAIIGMFRHNNKDWYHTEHSGSVG